MDRQLTDAQDAEAECRSAASQSRGLPQGALFKKPSKAQGFVASLQELGWALQELLLGSLRRLAGSQTGALH